MATFQCFDEEIQENLVSWTLGREESHHLVKVLRAKEGDKISILNGKGLRLRGELHTPNAKGSVVKIHQSENIERIEPSIQLVVGIPKIKTLDTIIRQATELGLAKVILLNGERSEVPKSFLNSEEKLEKLKRVAREACKQSENPYLPEIEFGPTIVKWISDLSEPGLYWVAHPNREKAISTIPAKPMATQHWILVGPEGGLTDIEYSAAREKGFMAISLGANILRVETACTTLAAIARFGPIFEQSR